jgi:hypothetical protein
MNRLLEIGFQLVGHWSLREGDPVFELTRMMTDKKILYAFVSDGEVKYIGKTIQSLSSRMYGYQRPDPTQTTNVRNQANIKALLDWTRQLTFSPCATMVCFIMGPFT